MLESSIPQPSNTATHQSLQRSMLHRSNSARSLLLSSFLHRQAAWSAGPRRVLDRTDVVRMLDEALEITGAFPLVPSSAVMRAGRSLQQSLSDNSDGGRPLCTGVATTSSNTCSSLPPLIHSDIGNSNDEIKPDVEIN
jgi:hypothetical protein